MSAHNGIEGGPRGQTQATLLCSSPVKLTGLHLCELDVFISL